LLLLLLLLLRRLLPKPCLLRSLWLEALILLLPREASELRLQLRGLLAEASLLRLLLSKALRLARIACELLLHWLHRASSKACRLRLQAESRLLGLHPALEALLLAKLLLLAILRLRRPSSTVPAP
jgi:hypothetical protein